MSTHHASGGPPPLPKPFGGVAQLDKKLSDLGHRRTQAVLQELHDDLPVFEKAGFFLHSMEVELGVSPKLIPRFRVAHSISPEAQQEILEEVRQKRVLHTLLALLFKSSHLSDIMKIGDLEFHAFKIEVGAIPTVSLVFSHPGDELMVE